MPLGIFFQKESMTAYLQRLVESILFFPGFFFAQPECAAVGTRRLFLDAGAPDVRQAFKSQPM